MPFQACTSEGVLTLTLDTPGSPVNIFNHATAIQLREILGSIDASATRAIVFETAKPASFLNGVGLMLAHAARTHDDILVAAEPPWAAYRAVWESPVPTIAVVQGNCFGCGVEFALSCDYRIASDACATQFYMTELNDYLFIPLFGSTWNLPEAVGMEAAIDLLLWGERWSAPAAATRGLIDESVPHEELGERTRAFVGRVLADERPTRRRGAVQWSEPEDRAVQRARDRIAELPPPYRAVYGEGLRLLELGARKNGSYIEHQRRELMASSASALAPIGKAAYSFFYLRQMAGQRAAGPARAADADLRLAASDAEDGDAHVLLDDFRRCRLTGVRFVEEGDADIRLVAAGHDGRTLDARGLDVAVRLSLTGPPSDGWQIHAPAYRAGARLVELARKGDPAGARADAADKAAHALARALQSFGLEVARTAPSSMLVTDRLLIAYWNPILAYLRGGGEAGIVNETLRDAGFVRRPGELIGMLGRDELAALLAAAVGRPAADLHAELGTLAGNRACQGRSDGALLAALGVSLLEACVTVRTGREVRDCTITDLIARELLDFPRHLCSLASWLTRARVAEALKTGEGMAALAGESAVECARSFVAEGREFYR